MLRFLPFLILIAVAVWWGVSLWQKRSRGPAAGPRRPRRRIDPPRGPDDDPDFLRGL